MDEISKKKQNLHFQVEFYLGGIRTLPFGWKKHEKIIGRTVHEM